MALASMDSLTLPVGLDSTPVMMALFIFFSVLSHLARSPFRTTPTVAPAAAIIFQRKALEALTAMVFRSCPSARPVWMSAIASVAAPSRAALSSAVWAAACSSVSPADRKSAWQPMRMKRTIVIVTTASAALREQRRTRYFCMGGLSFVEVGRIWDLAILTFWVFQVNGSKRMVQAFLSWPAGMLV